MCFLDIAIKGHIPSASDFCLLMQFNPPLTQNVKSQVSSWTEYFVKSDFFVSYVATIMNVLKMNHLF